MAETTTLARSNPFGSNYRVVAGNNPKAQVTTKNSSNPSGAVRLEKAWHITGDNDINKLRTMVNQRNVNDRANYAYDVALNLARRDQEQDRRRRGFANFNTEADLTFKADKYYDQLMQGAEHPTGAQIRGENAFTQALGGIREGINGFNNMIGTGIDWGVDRFGDLVGAVTGRDDWRQSIQDATTGEDLAIIPSILTDIGLVALTGPVGGAALLGAKGLLQHSDNFQEALTGIDHITGERLTDGQRLANTAAGLGGTALTMLPGMSAAKAGEKLIGKELAEKGGKAAKEGLESAEAAIQKTSKSAGEDLAKYMKEENPASKLSDDLTKINAGIVDGIKRPTTAEILANPTSLSKFNEALENATKKAWKEYAEAGQKRSIEASKLHESARAREVAEKDLAAAKELAEQEAVKQTAFEKYFAPVYGEKAIEGGTRIPVALRNPFSREARDYNRMAKNAYKDILKREYVLDRDGGRKVLDKDGNVKQGEDGKDILEKAGGTRKAIWNLINGKTLGKAALQKENVAAAKAAAQAAQEADTKGVLQGLKKMFSNEGIRKATKGQQGKGVGDELFGPGALKGFGLTAGSGLAEAMANTPGGFSAAAAGLSDQIGQAQDGQLLPLALAMLPGYRKGFARMFGGNTLPYYGVKAHLAQQGVNDVYLPRYTDEDNENLLKAIGGK